MSRKPRLSVQDKLAEKEAQEKLKQKQKEEREREQQEKEARIRELKEKMKDPEYRAQRKEEMKRIKAERQLIRKEIRSKGLKTYADYSFFCKELLLGYPEDTREARWDERRATLSSWFHYVLSRINLLTLLLLTILILLIIFLFAFVSEEKGRFTVNLTADMLREGFELSESPDFDKTKTRLFAKEITNSNATSVYEMSRGLADADGSHNGPGYMAYTFYIRNGGTMTVDYGYTVNILSETMNVGSATWMMFYEDEKQIMYAEATPEGGPENLWGYPDAPFAKDAYDAEAQYYEDEGRTGIITTPFLDENTALQGKVTEFGPGDVKRYTIVVWLEGDDPDCTNALLGGHISFNIQFDRLGTENPGYFKGLYREEYDKYYRAEEIPEGTRPDNDNIPARQTEPNETEPVTVIPFTEPEDRADGNNPRTTKPTEAETSLE